MHSDGYKQTQIGKLKITKETNKFITSQKTGKDSRRQGSKIQKKALFIGIVKRGPLFHLLSKPCPIRLIFVLKTTLIFGVVIADMGS